MDLFLLQAAPGSGTGIDAAYFEQLKTEILSYYDQIKSFKRMIKEANRDWNYKTSFDNRTEFEVKSLDMRIEKLKAERDAKLRAAVEEISGHKKYANREIDQIRVEFDKLMGVLSTYAKAGKLSKAQTAFYSQIGDFFRTQLDATNVEVDTILTKADMDETQIIAEFEDKRQVFYNAIGDLGGMFYKEVSDIQDRFAMVMSDKDTLYKMLDDTRAKHEAEVAKLVEGIDAAKAAGDEESVGILTAKLKDAEANFVEFELNWNIDYRNIRAEEKAIQIEFSWVIDQMYKNADKVLSTINNWSSVFGEETPWTIEKVYEFVTKNSAPLSEREVWDAVQTLIDEYETFNAAYIEQDKANDEYVKNVFSVLGRLQRDINESKPYTDELWVADETARIAQMIAEISEKLANSQANLEDLVSSADAMEAAIKDAEAEKAALDPASPTYAEDLANIDRLLTDYKVKLDNYLSKAEDYKMMIDDLQAEKADMERFSAEFPLTVSKMQTRYADATAAYATEKEALIKSQDEYALWLQEQEMAKKEMLINIEQATADAQSIDTFKASVDLANMNISIDIAAKVSSDIAMA